eukprot:GSA25T00013296001.1
MSRNLFRACAFVVAFLFCALSIGPLRRGVQCLASSSWMIQ